MFVAGVVLPAVHSRIAKVKPVSGDHSLSDLGGRKISVVIAAYLESSVIGETIRLVRAQLSAHGPAGSRVLVVASDEATARSASAAGAEVIFRPPSGKPMAVNEGVTAADGDIVVLTDANCAIVPDTWPRFVLEDLQVASIVSGKKSETRGPEAAFWAYERYVNDRGQRDLSDSLAVVGEFLAFRAKDYVPLPPQTLVDDLETAFSFDRRNLRVVVDRRIVTTEEAAAFREQIERRTRIAAGLIAFTCSNFRTLAGTDNGREFLLHKAYRSTIGALGFWSMFVASLWIAPPYTAVLAVLILLVSLIVYASPALGLPASVRAVAAGITLQSIPVLALPRVVANASGRRATGWKKVPR